MTRTTAAQRLQAIRAARNAATVVYRLRRTLSSRDTKRLIYRNQPYEPKLTQKLGLKLGASKIHGVGLFAARRIPRGRTICYFPTRYKALNDARTNLTYQWRVDGYSGIVIDQWDDHTVSRYINSSGDKQRATATVYWHGPVGRVVAAQPIGAGQEVTLPYRLPAKGHKR